MEIESENQENIGFLGRIRGWFKALWENVVSRIVGAARDAKKIGEEDPRRCVHAVKVGLAIGLVSLLYYFDPLYQGFGVSAMWAIMTVVVVFEFSVGATFGRGVNRGIATLLGGALGVGVHRLASLSGIEMLEPAFLGLFVFLFAAVVTFLRFFPKLKARYDYGLLIFNLTFCLITVSAYRDDEVLDQALTRLSTICIGCFATMSVCVLLFPVWAGEDLHYLVADNIEKLGKFLEGFGDEYFRSSGDENQEERALLEDYKKDNRPLLEEYKSVLNSKTIEDSLVNFARWEPPHGRFRYGHPWTQYQKIGALTRECAYRLDSLNSYLNDNMQMPDEIRAKFQESCQQMSSECSYALKELTSMIRSMTTSSTVKSHIENAKAAANSIKLMLKTNPCPDKDLLEIIPVATVCSILLDVVFCAEKIAESVHELAQSNFKPSDGTKKPEQIDNNSIMRSPSIEGSHSIDVSAE